MSAQRESNAGAVARGALVLALLLTLLALAGCESGETTLTADDDGSQVSMAVGETLLVELAGNPTTGFQWTEDEPLPGILDQTSSEYAQDESSEDMVGVGGTYRFRYEAVEAGDGELSFTNARSGEPPEVAETWSVTVEVSSSE